MSDYKKAKRKLLILFAIFLAIGIAAAVIGYISIDTSWGVFVLILGILILVAVVCVSASESLRIRRIHCKKCGTLYNYETDVSWDEVSRSETDKGAVKAIVEVECNCHNCGADKVFRHTVTVGSYDDKGRFKVVNLSQSMKKYFKDKV